MLPRETLGALSRCSGLAGVTVIGEPLAAWGVLSPELPGIG